MKTKLLICGATGFIGRNLVEQLSKQQTLEVHAVRYHHSAYDCGNDVIWHQADLRNQDDVDRVVKGMDIIIQAAAATASTKELSAKPYLNVTDNAIMNSYLFRFAFDHKIKHVVFFSSTDMYHSSKTPLKETDYDANKPLPLDHAGIGHTKRYLEEMCEFYAGTSNTKYTVIRHSNIYGPHDKFDLERSHLFGSAMTKALTAKDTVVISGTGEEECDLLYIDDLIHFVKAVIEKQPEQFRLYNCGYGQAITATQLVEKIIQHSGKELRIEHDTSKPATVNNSLALDCTLAQNELDWKVQTDLDTGIRKTISWWRENVRAKVAEVA